MEEGAKELTKKEFGVQPLFSKVIITLDLDEVEEGDVVLNESGLSEVQTVMAAGPNTTVKPGSRVILDLEKMSVRTPVKTDQYQTTSSIKIDPITVDGITYAFIEDRCIKAIDNR